MKPQIRIWSGMVRVILLVSFLCCRGLPAGQGQEVSSGVLFSPQIAGEFHRIAVQGLSAGADVKQAQVEQAFVFINAAPQLDSRTDYVYTDVLELSPWFTDNRYYGDVLAALKGYTKNQVPDIEPARKAIGFLLSQQNLRQERQALLQDLLWLVSRNNPVLASDMALHQALLSAERADFDAAIQMAIAAHELNPYNRQAFDALQDMLQRNLQQVKPSIYAVYLRHLMDASPMDMDNCMAFARFAEQLQMHDVAAAAYEYAADLSAFLIPGEPLSAQIYLPWAFNAYNSDQYRSKCVEIARRLRNLGRFDIAVEGIAAAVTSKMPELDPENRARLAVSSEEESLLRDGKSARATPMQLAYFYCFAVPNPEKALAWANKVYSAEPNSTAAKAIFGYSLVMNNQHDLAVQYIEGLEDREQAGAVAMAMVQLNRDQKDLSIATLKKAVAVDPVSLAAFEARRLLKANGSEYLPELSPDPIRSVLQEKFGRNIVPAFVKTDRIFTAKLTLGGSEFMYDSPIDAKLTLVNSSPHPIIISDAGMFTGRIRLDVHISGDITMNLPGLVTKTVAPAVPIAAGQHIIIPLDVEADPLRTLLSNHPQATLQMEFVVYLDPEVGADGKVRCGIPGLEPAGASARRIGVVLTRQFVSQRLDVLTKGQEGQKISSVQLFAGLLAEQYMQKKPTYRYARLEKVILIDAVRRALADESWKVRAMALVSLLSLPGELDFELTEQVAGNIQHNAWPVRLLSIYLLQRSGSAGFKDVLDWAAKHDPHPAVRNMALVLTGKPSQAGQTEQVSKETRQEEIQRKSGTDMGAKQTK